MLFDLCGSGDPHDSRSGDRRYTSGAAPSAALYNKPMPELPEVETIARGVNRRVRGDRIVQAWFSRLRQTFKTPASRQAKGLAERTILAVHRTGKHIVFELGSGTSAARAPKGDANAKQATTPDAQWIVHLGNDGAIAGCDAGCSRGPAHARAARLG